MEKVPTYIINGNDLNDMLKNLKLQEDNISIDKWNCKYVSIEFVAWLHDVTEATVRNYIKRGFSFFYQ